MSRLAAKPPSWLDDLFNHSNAHVLLLSATPYKPFTFAEESGPDGGHYADFVKTLDFLAASDSVVDSVRTNLDELRQAALSGDTNRRCPGSRAIPTQKMDRPNGEASRQTIVQPPVHRQE